VMFPLIKEILALVPLNIAFGLVALHVLPPSSE
jgi:hypothetical protein